MVDAASTTVSPLDIQIVKDAALNDAAAFDPNNLQETTRQALSRAQVLISEPAMLAKLLQHDPTYLPCLKWCQSTYAGVDPLFKAHNLELPLSFCLTRFAGAFGPPIAEWCLARIIGHERKFATTLEDQQAKTWAAAGSAVQKYRYLRDLTLSILGCGDIGFCIGPVAKAFGMRVVGYVRTARELNDAGIDETTTDLQTALREADYIVSVLPSTPETRGLLGGDALQAASEKSPVFLNVGRGDVIDEASLIRALDSGYISAAILDVFETEPLPIESALWSRPDVIVSPHVSGMTQAKDVPAVFFTNYERFVTGKKLLYEVDWSKGY